MAEAIPSTQEAAPTPKAEPKEVSLNGKVEVEPTEEFIVNGKPVKLTKTQIKTAVQKGMFADQKLEGIKNLQGKTQSLLSALKTPEGFLQLLKTEAKELGVEPKAYLRSLVNKGLVDEDDLEFLAEQTSTKWLPRQKMTPEQVQAQKESQELAQYKKAEADRQAKELSEASQKQVQQIRDAIRIEVGNQIKADKTFPMTEGTVNAVFGKLRVMNQQGAPVTVDNIGKAISLVKKDLIFHQQTILDAIEDPEKLIEMFGKERALKISRGLIAMIQSQAKKADVKEPKAESGIREKVTERIDKKLGRTPQGYTVLDV